MGLHKYLPYRPWFRRELANYVTDVLTDPQTARLPYWNAGALSSIARDHVAGRRNYVREINTVVTLAAVDRLLVRGQPGQS
jgi:asparagine synthase (glutamine-hydrolysing)